MPLPTVESFCRQQLLFETFAECSITGSSTPTSQTPFAILVKKLQESLTWMESFEVVMVSHGIDGMFPIFPISNVYLDLKWSSALMLSQQLQLCLVTADGSEFPCNCSNIIISIHVIAIFQALNNSLQPCISRLLGGMGGSHLSSMLAALVASVIPAS